MAIEFQCPNCESVLRVGDENAGKRARCPHCQMINFIPGQVDEDRTLPPSGFVGSTPLSDQAPTTQPLPNSGTHLDAAPTGSSSADPMLQPRFLVESVSGKTFGPASRIQLDTWAQQGRVSAECRIRDTTTGEARLGSDFYPELSSIQTAATNPLHERASKSGTYFPNPYAAPSSDAHDPLVSSEGIEPTEVTVSDVFNSAFAFYKQRFLLLTLAGGVLAFLHVINESGPPTVVSLGLNLLEMFLSIGLTQVALKICRGQSTEFSDLFGGGNLFWPILGYSILTILALAFGFVLLVVPGFLLIIYYWTSYHLIIDRKCRVLESFEIASTISAKNVSVTIVLGLVSFGITVLGASVLNGFGLAISIGFISILLTVAYLMMSGQMQVPSKESP